MRSKPALPNSATEALPGRSTPIPVRAPHAVLGTSMTGPWPEGSEVIYVAMGCFWGAERLFWQLPGVWTTAAGYAGGYTPNPTYDETCTGRTGHTEAVLVVYDPTVASFEALMKSFWENHDPTQVNGQGNDHGTQYRTAVYPTTAEQLAAVEESRERYQRALTAKGYGEITTEVRMFDDATGQGAGPWYYAEDYHQQYLHKNPRGYCNHGFCQVAYDVEDHGQVARAELPSA